MSFAELAQNILELSQADRHELLVWLYQLEAPQGDIPGEALDQLAAEIWHDDDQRRSPAE